MTTTTNGTGPQNDDPEQARPSEPELNAALAEAVRHAIGQRVAASAKDIATAVFEEFLTPAVLEQMQDTARKAAQEAVAPAPTPEETAEEEQKQLFYPNVEAFVEKFLAVVYAREVVRARADTDIKWCPQWHDHPEAASRLGAMWRAWEHARLGKTSELSSWWRDHADHHMAVLMSPDGPFKNCSIGKGKHAVLDPLPLEAATPGSFDDPFEVVDVAAESSLVMVTGSPRRGTVVAEFP
ncbi:DUF4913 domain-containing protein [Nocardia sp. alder85J]|uniref:DUF4913 domain-containing protein n=1 Tax=Nocardia sp. alder85J TaxID=2862949 RepID=UPI001CD44087|nr:DUF4913 domain-containing protein [Nocardia sp. alder85J]MCX4099218.1 DUF4913 domain-containing protein [Nocardia sp. alder85J]